MTFEERKNIKYDYTVTFENQFGSFKFQCHQSLNEIENILTKLDAKDWRVQ